MELNFIVAVVSGAIDHIWLVFVAVLISFAVLRLRKNEYSFESASLWMLFGVLSFLAIVPNGFHATFSPDIAELALDEVKNLPNYKALFTADVILVFLGFVGGAKLA